MVHLSDDKHFKGAILIKRSRKLMLLLLFIEYKICTGCSLCIFALSSDSVNMDYLLLSGLKNLRVTT
jgi:Pyruvate/2-oxoacid:ferredoxin oxidoreductase delta subunit